MNTRRLSVPTLFVLAFGAGLAPVARAGGSLRAGPVRQRETREPKRASVFPADAGHSFAFRWAARESNRFPVTTIVATFPRVNRVYSCQFPQ